MALLIEGTGAALAIVYLLLALKQNIYCWFAWILSSFLYLFVMYQAGLYMESLLQIFYLSMGFYGLSQWRNSGIKSENLHVRTWVLQKHIFAISLVLILSLSSGYFLNRFTNAVFPFIDAFTSWGAVIATYMVAKKVLENWVYWFVIDFISVFLFASRDLYFTSFLFAVYLIIIFFGYRSWVAIKEQQDA